MTNDVKNAWDVALSIITMSGAAVAFIVAVLQWRRGQAWQRADRLDKFIEHFEQDSHLRLAATILDWSAREDVNIDGAVTEMLNNDVLRALRDHRTISQRPMFPNPQPAFREAYDAFLTFLSRLEMSITTGLIDLDPTRNYFIYWLERFLHFDRHPDTDKVLGELTPEKAVMSYIKVYGDPASVIKLCEHFGVVVPAELKIRY